jgi:hypothetical protein
VLGVPPWHIIEYYDSAYFEVRDTIRPIEYKLHYLHRSPWYPFDGFIPPDSIAYAEYGPFDLTLYVYHDTLIAGLAVMRFWGYHTGLDVKNDREQSPYGLSVRQNYPNPFNQRTNLRFVLSRPAVIEIGAYNLLGHRVDVLERRFFDLGEHSVSWEPISLSSGVYLVKFQSATMRTVVRCILVK